MSPVSDKTSDLKKPAPWNSTLASAEKMQRLDRLANLGMLSAAMAHEIRYLVLIKLSPRGSLATQQCYVAGDRINFVHTLKWRTLIEDLEIYPDVTSPYGDLVILR